MGTAPQRAPQGPAAILIGPPGAGKTTIGRRLAKVLRVEFLDIDEEIERREGRTIPQIFAGDGEPAFRAIEERVVADVVAAHNGVVSLGGGAVLAEGTRELLRSHQVVYLELTEEEGIRRTVGTARPLLKGDDPAAAYRALMARRTPIYRELATIRVSTVGRAPGSVVRQVQRRLKDTAPARVRRSPWPLLPAVLRTSTKNRSE
ncbi:MULTISPECIES: shikimate kinase [Tsukamurella]|uniref:Shikimate kinase n=1 Tax=Tsukamurella strandjordii TaxID=147577 RepID=A0AA90NJ70_9ACTN|nr:MULTISPECIES: shikimate kinase [Tsukamurella]MDP0399446.1 shikimate kinase [Tsukamurella strandjordii]GIZ95619.1 shikimate kinase [Tsukamurella sp. TY48]